MIIDTDQLDQIIEVSHDMTRGMPNHVTHPEFNFVPYYRLGDLELENGYWGCNELLLMSGHSGTHLDALGHVASNGMTWGGVPAADAQSGIEGLVQHGIETASPFIGRAVVIDVAGHRGVEVVSPEMPIDLTEVQTILAHNNLGIHKGDAVLIRTGWSVHWEDTKAYLGEETGSPGIAVEVAEWLAEQGVAIVGGETAVVEHHPRGGGSLPVHQKLLAESGVHLLENMQLDGLAGVTHCLFLCLPLRIRGASGSPVRPVAVTGFDPSI